VLPTGTPSQIALNANTGDMPVEGAGRVQLSIIVPVLNEEPNLRPFLQHLALFRSRGAEIIVADGASTDRSPEIARTMVDRVILSPRGRARQMNAGATAARGEVLLFLHADTYLPEAADSVVSSAFSEPSKLWGRFDIVIDSPHPLLEIIGRMINLRSRLSGIATGDQAIFVRRCVFEAAGGYEDIPLMEDIALSRKLKRISPPICLRASVVTSGRRWHKHGVLRTILMMWRLRLEYYLGVAPEVLARRYGYTPHDG